MSTSTDISRLLAELGPFPTEDFGDQPAWWSRAIASLTNLVIEGRPLAELLATVRAAASASNRVMPHDALVGARQILADDQQVLRQIGGRKAEIRRPLPCWPSPCAPDRPCTNHDTARARLARREVD